MKTRPGTVLIVVRSLLLLGVVLGAIYVRVISSGERELGASTEALRAGDAHEAIVRARRSASYYAPGAPHVRVAYARLVALGTAAEGLGKRDVALLAWMGVRSASLGSRWLLTPHAADLELANQAIARLSSTAPRPPGTRLEPPAKFEREQLEVLGRTDGPQPVWVVTLVLAFGAWIAGLGWIAVRAIDATGHIAQRRALPGALLAIGGLGLWLLALWRA